MSTETTRHDPHRAGYIALTGLPNVGKSTLLNRCLGQKVSITSRRPQTTRNSIRGIYNSPGVQAILIDTPGIHRAWSRLNRSMVQAAMSTLQEVDAICWLVDSPGAAARISRGKPVIHAGHRAMVGHLQAARAPIVLALNKIDSMDRQQLLPIIEAFKNVVELASIVPISALKGDGVSTLLDQLVAFLPRNPPFFPADQLVDHSERFVVAEIIREKIFRLTGKEIPYATAVEVERFEEEERTSRQPLVRIWARIVVERKSQKAIVIGKKGSMLKNIGTLARADIEKLLGVQVYLQLFVALEKDWSRNPRLLRELGYE